MSHLSESLERLRILINDPTHPLSADWLAAQCGCDPVSLRRALAGELAFLPDGNHQFMFELAKAIREDPDNGADLDTILANLPVVRVKNQA